ncbi:hypothetical protein Bca4012_065659 [Brassica carinata]|uniref:Uncharacterized protein n=1 Tax=Brassica carinata TaxID=52824 RepID=A0A8X7VNL1_BRACI|nr:hypothetical protein Bca52824_017971 [Brassica carinata]
MTGGEPLPLEDHCRRAPEPSPRFVIVTMNRDEVTRTHIGATASITTNHYRSPIFTASPWSPELIHVVGEPSMLCR